ncbi:hypothetical protein DSO57_1003043 [Entomophthora muscae]|uniref:Uncharacterized protein n=1 Tax=Entomophthora muscae TaxID=34485 RepID=A0ACC2TJJ8_9FUNG|nr:hypothetical protein DSO57_1003043 [Entomophthora muscae]
MQTDCQTRESARPWILRVTQDRYSTLQWWELMLVKSVATFAKRGAQLIVPLGIVAGLYGALIRRELDLFGLGLILWGVSEIGFAVYWQVELSKPFQRKASPMSLKDKINTSHRLMEHVDDMQDMLGDWMLQRPDKVPASHIYSWIIYLLFDKDESDLTPDESEEADVLFSMFGDNFMPKHDSTCDSESPSVAMRPSLDPMWCFPKPFLFYLVIQASHWVGAMVLRLEGFRYHKVQGQGYWRLEGTTKQDPILYIHGVGVGFPMYTAKLKAMCKRYKGREVILLELPHISMAPCGGILNHDQTLKALDAIFCRHQICKVSLVAHSFGTIIASWLIRQRPNSVSRLTMFDPVCFRIWDSTLARNFLYAEPFSFIHELMRFFVAMDPLITQTVSKELYWYESVLFPEDIHVPTNIFLSRDDWVVDAIECQEYLQDKLPKGSHLKLMDTSHAGCLRSSKFYNDIIDKI